MLFRCESCLSPHAPSEIIAESEIYPRAKKLTYSFGSLAHRGRRLKRRRMTERGAVPDNGIAVEPREAQRPTSLAARTPTAAILGNGDIAVGAIKRTLARSVREPRKLPGASRRSIPSKEGEGKQGCGLPRPPEIQTAGWRSVG